MSINNTNTPKVLRSEYNAVKNHIHNTLNLTKEDITQIIKETVHTEVGKIIKHGDIDQIIQNIIRNEIYETMRDRRYFWNTDTFRSLVSKKLNEGICDIISNQLSINVEVNKLTSE